MPTIKTISTLDLRKRLGELTDEVLYANVWLKVTKNRNKALLVKPWEEGTGAYAGSQEDATLKKREVDDFMQKLDRIRKENSKRTQLVDGISWSAFIRKDRRTH